MDRTCSIDGCDLPHYGLSWCIKHWRALRPRPTCSVEECDGRAEKRGWCATHYRRWWLHGDPLGSARADAPTECAIADCSRPIAAWGWCTLHYGRWRSHGDAAWTPTAKPTTCTVDECEAAAGTRGMCTKHYARWNRHGDPETDKRDLTNRYEVTADGTHTLIMIDREGREATVYYDAEDDGLVRSRRWHRSGGGYAVHFLPRDPHGHRRQVRMHRFLLGLSDGTPGEEVDHRNGQRTDNRRSNLRLVPHQVNASNRQNVNGVGSSRYRGVSWDRHRQGWAAYVKVDYRKRHLGVFPTEAQAAEAVSTYRRSAGLPDGY